MIEKFPDLIDNEVALFRAERDTGHVIDENFQLAVSDLQKVFTVFSNVSIAFQAAKEIIRRKNDIEIVLYGKDKTVLHFVTVDNLNQI